MKRYTSESIERGPNINNLHMNRSLVQGERDVKVRDSDEDYGNHDPDIKVRKSYGNGAKIPYLGGRTDYWPDSYRDRRDILPDRFHNRSTSRRRSNSGHSRSFTPIDTKVPIDV